MSYDNKSRDELLKQVSILRQQVIDLTHQLMLQPKESEPTIFTDVAYWQLIAENVQDMMSLHTPEGTFLYVNPTSFNILGYEPLELIGIDPYALFHPEDKERIRGASHDVVLNEHVERFVTYRMRHKTGHYIWIESLTKPVMNEQNEVVYLIASSRDVTERMRFIQRLRILHRVDQAILRADTPQDIAQMTLTSLCNLLPCQRAFVASLVAESDDLIILYDTSETSNIHESTIYQSDEWLPHIKNLKTGQTISSEDLKTEVALSPMEQLLFDDDLSAYICVPLLVQQQFSGCLCLGFSRTQKLSDELRTIADEVASQIAIGIEQARLYTQIRQQNILLEQRVINRTQQLQHAKDRMEAIFNNSTDAIILTDGKGRIQQVNQTFRELFDYHTDELFGQPVDLLVAENMREALTHTFQSLQQTGKSKRVEIAMRRKDGSTFDADSGFALVKNGESEETYLVCSIRDISKRKAMEATIIKERNLLQTLINNLPAHIYVKDTNSQFLLVNSTVIQRFGKRSADEIIGKSDADFFKADKAAEKLADEQKVSQTGQPLIDKEETYIDDTGKAIWVNSTKIPLYDQQGNITGLVGISYDITDRKQAMESLQLALQKERELNELRSRLTSMVSHEFRTPLASIQSSTDILMHYADHIDDTKRHNQLERIQTQIKRLTSLMEDVLAMGKAEGATPHWEFVDLSALSSDIISEIQQPIPQFHPIQLSTRGVCSDFKVDPGLFRQILTNLLSNAIKYSPLNGKIFVELTCTQDQAILKVRDEGIGIPNADQKHLFETFHRAGNVGDIAGTGLGLVIVKRAVEAHQGAIDVISQEGQGTTFEIKLPR